MSASRAFGLLAVVLGLFLALPGRGEAGNVTVQNKSVYDADMVFMFYDYEKEYFYVYGWYKVSAGQTTTFFFKNDPDRHFYWFAKAIGQYKTWPHSGDRKQAIVDRLFEMPFDEVAKEPGSYVVRFATRKTARNGNLVIDIVN